MGEVLPVTAPEARDLLTWGFRHIEAEVRLQGHKEFHQQRERAKQNHQKLKEETLYKNLATPDRPRPRGCYVSSSSSNL